MAAPEPHLYIPSAQEPELEKACIYRGDTLPARFFKTLIPPSAEPQTLIIEIRPRRDGSFAIDLHRVEAG